MGGWALGLDSNRLTLNDTRTCPSHLSRVTRRGELITLGTMHSQPEACMPQLRGVDRNHTASLVLVARFVKRPALGIRLITNEPPDGENDIAVVAEHAAKLGLELAALSGMRDDRVLTTWMTE